MSFRSLPGRSVLAAFWLAADISGAFAQDEAAFETKASQVFMVDVETGTVLFAKDPDAPIPPASLAKLMTAEVIFDALKSGQRSLDDTFTVSENAWRTGGAPSGTSTMFAALKSTLRLEDLIQGIVVQSANDGCIIVAEGMAGSDEKFAELMNARARALGLSHSVFRNSTGLPAKGQTTTARELVLLGQHLWRDYPEFYKYYAQPDFTWNKITQRNRNPLLAMDIGADGLQIGFAEGYGYSILGSAAQGDRRVFAALGGMTSERERAEEARKLIDWGMKAFTRKGLFKDGDLVGEASVYGGEKSSVGLQARGPVNILLPAANHDKVSARIVYQGPVSAPVAKGAALGRLEVWVGDVMSQETPLYASEDVGVGGLHRRALDAITELLTGWLRIALPS